jgi:hypothetical protein
MKLSLATLVAAALLVPCAGQAATRAAPASLSMGKSFLDHVNANYAEEPPYSVPADLPRPPAPQPRRQPEPGAMLLACLGLILYVGRRRAKILEA